MSDAKPYTTMECLYLCKWGEPPDCQRTIATVVALDAAQAEVTALRQQLKSAEMKYEAAEKLAADKKVWNEYIDGKFEEARAALVKQRDESAALSERMREALVQSNRYIDEAVQKRTRRYEEEAAKHGFRSVEAREQSKLLHDLINGTRNSFDSVHRALSEPIAPWLRERDRALAMKVAEAVYRDSFSEFFEDRPDKALSDADREHLAAIVAEVVP